MQSLSWRHYQYSLQDIAIRWHRIRITFGDALNIHINAPTLVTKQYGVVPALDVSASYDTEAGEGPIFLVNRSQTEGVVTDLMWQDGKPIEIDKAWQLTGKHAKDGNSWEYPERVTAKRIAAPTIEANCRPLILPPLSFTVIANSSKDKKTPEK
jgi:alpha-L-arabinofuranosidase